MIILNYFIVVCAFIILPLMGNETSKKDLYLSGYLELLEKHPHLRQTGDHRKGEIEIIVDETVIEEIMETEYMKLIKQNVPPDTARQWSRPGIVYSDPYLLWIKDPVIFPNGQKSLFKRIIWRCTLNEEKPVAVLPMTKEGKICLVKIWRHATGSWELEVPRGAPNKNELPVHNALRELREETGFVAETITSLGCVNPDSGVLATNIEVFMALGSCTLESELDEAEVISGIYLFTIPELEAGIKQGFLEIEEEGNQFRIYLRDPFLTYALYQARIRGFFDRK